jgi:hypothetical protein
MNRLAFIMLTNQARARLEHARRVAILADLDRFAEALQDEDEPSGYDNWLPPECQYRPGADA